MAQIVKNLPAMWETLVQSMGWEDLLEKGMATRSIYLFGCAGSKLLHVGSSSLTWDQTLVPWIGDCRVLATGPPGKFLVFFCFNLAYGKAGLVLHPNYWKIHRIVWNAKFWWDPDLLVTKRSPQAGKVTQTREQHHAAAFNCSDKEHVNPSKSKENNITTLIYHHVTSEIISHRPTCL